MTDRPRWRTVEGMAEQPRPLGWWVALVDRLVDGRLESALDEHGVSREQWALLAQLRRGPLPLAMLESPANVDDLDELVESGWVSPGPPAALTPVGQAAADRIAEVVESIAGLVDSAVDPAERAVVAAALQAAARSMGWSDED